MQNYRLQLRRDTAERWAYVNPRLADGEPGYETDTGRMKIGNNKLLWTELDYFSGGAVVDDGTSLLLLYENAKV